MRPPRHRPRTLWGDLAGLWGRVRRLPVAAQLVVGAIAAILVIGLASVVLRTGSGTEVTTRPATTLRTTPPTIAATTTTVVIPAGDDVALKSVLDGDSFEIADGTKIRLIGVDAPDVETDACYSTEATVHLRQLLEPGRGLRLVYDTTRTDRLGRTLAYVYRLPDGLLVNVALAQDGFANFQASSTNTLHAAQIQAAVESARTARRGLWQACESSTTATTARTATTSGSTATTSGGSGTTTTAPASSATTTGNTAPGPVVFGEICVQLGATSTFANGDRAVCATDPEGVRRWSRA